LGKYEDAIICYDRAIAINPKDSYFSNQGKRNANLLFKDYA
jgi:tetratricopeptide (TPR) repeat protein